MTYQRNEAPEPLASTADEVKLPELPQDRAMARDSCHGEETRGYDADDMRAYATAALKAQAAEKEAEIARLQARLNWLANAVLCCDYGDNDETVEQVGWGVQHSRRNGRSFMFGPSIDTAIDAAMKSEEKG